MLSSLGQMSNRGQDVDSFIPVVVAMSNDCIYNCLQNSHHYLTHFLIHCPHILTVTTTTIHQRISLYTLSIFHTAKKKHTLHTLNVERISNEWRAPFVLLAINLHWDWGSRRNNLVHLASTWCQRHIWRSWSWGTPHHYFHTAMLLQDAVWGYVMNSSLSR